MERFIENCDDPALVERVAFSLVGKTVDLSTMEQTVVGMLRGAMEDFDEAMEKERKRVADYRKRQAKARKAEERSLKNENVVSCVSGAPHGRSQWAGGGAGGKMPPLQRRRRSTRPPRRR